MGPGHPEFWDAYYTQQVLPKDIDPVDGVMVITFCEVLAAIRNFGITEKSSVIIYGAGAVGLTFIKLMKLTGVRIVIAVDVAEEKRADVADAGADFFINSRRESVQKKVREILPQGADFVLDAVGANSLIQEGICLLKENGQFCVYGICPAKDVEFSWAEAPRNFSIRYLHMPVKEQQAAAFPVIIEWVREGKIQLSDYISHRIPFSNILDAFQMVEANQTKKKIVIIYK